jgi:hypothetical protein
MVERAARPLFEDQAIDPAGNVDLLITNTLLPDMPITGCSAEVARRLGCNPEWIRPAQRGLCGFSVYAQVGWRHPRGPVARTALLLLLGVTRWSAIHLPTMTSSNADGRLGKDSSRRRTLSSSTVDQGQPDTFRRWTGTFRRVRRTGGAAGAADLPCYQGTDLRTACPGSLS